MLLNLRCQVEKLEDLCYPSTCDVFPAGDSGLVSNLSCFQKAPPFYGFA